MPHFRGSPARPRHAVVLAVARTAQRLQGGRVERVLVLHVLLDPLRRLARVADGPHAAIDLACNVLDNGFVAIQGDVAEEAVGKAELLREHCHDGLIGQTIEGRLEHLVTPLNRSVRRGNGPVGFELRRRRQEIRSVGPVVHHRRSRGIRVDHDQKVQHLHGLLHVGSARLRVRRMSPENHGPDVVRLVVDVGLVLQDAVDPTADRDAPILHRLLRAELAEHPVVILLPNAAPVLPRARREPVVAWQRMRQDAQIRRPLHIVVAAEDVRSATLATHVPERQLQDAVGTGVVVALGVLGAAHAPDDGAPDGCWRESWRRGGAASPARL